MADNNGRLVEIVSELLFEVQAFRKDVNEKVGNLDTKVGNLDTKVGNLDTKIEKLREDMNRNHAKAMAGLMEVRTSVIHLDEQLVRITDVEERLRKLETTVYGKTG